MRNDYYEIAYNDLLYLQATLATGFYNNIAVGAQQVTEKMLKSVAERVCLGIEGLMHTHNLRGLYDAIHSVESSFILDRGELSILKDLYFDAKYPGDNFVSVTKEMCEESLSVMYDTIEAVNSLREILGLTVYPVERKNLKVVEKMGLF